MEEDLVVAEDFDLLDGGGQVGRLCGLLGVLGTHGCRAENLLVNVLHHLANLEHVDRRQAVVTAADAYLDCVRCTSYCRRGVRLHALRMAMFFLERRAGMLRINNDGAYFFIVRYTELFVYGTRRNGTFAYFGVLC